MCFWMHQQRVARNEDHGNIVNEGASELSLAIGECASGGYLLGHKEC